MAKGAAKGTLLLTLAQAYHALTGYGIFFIVARQIGAEAYGHFGLVLWTMTTLEILVTDGVPKAVAYFVARRPEASAALCRRGAWLTTLVAFGFAAVLGLVAPALADHWREPALVLPLRLAALDFLTFTGFAVVAQTVNGLHDFGRQAVIWLHYSTWKVVIVILAALLGGTLETIALGYVVASLVGSLGAIVFGAKRVRAGREPAPADAGTLGRFAIPLALQSFALGAIINLDFAAAGATSASRVLLGGYTAASTLARALYFIFKAFGEALFPAVARHLAQGELDAARRSAEKGLALLGCLLFPAAGLAAGTAGTVIGVLFGDPAYVAGASYLHLLAPAAALWALTAVLAALASASARPGRTALVLLVVLALTAAATYGLAAGTRLQGAALGTLLASTVGVLSLGLVATRALGLTIPVLRLLLAASASALLALTLAAWHPSSLLVFPYGALLYAVTVAALLGSGVVPGLRFGKRGAAKEL